MKVSTDETGVHELLTRSIAAVLPSTDALEKRLRSGDRLRVYLGIDPTGPHLHLGHATNLLLLRRLQNLGHEVILLIGDFTARIGDPTDKLATRQPLTEKQIEENLRTFKRQVEKIVPFTGKNPAHLEFNSRWQKGMTLEKIIELAHHFTVQQLEERDMFERRRKERKSIGLHEFLYPLMQGYDSVVLDVDVEVGGNDQLFNMMAGRTLMKALKNKEKFVVTTKLLVDPTTGKKIMNKSEGGLVNLDDEPTDMFGKIMALPDSTIVPIAEFSTEMPMREVTELSNEKNPRDAKLTLAHEIVVLYHSPAAADVAKKAWVKTFSEKSAPTDAPELKLAKREMTALDLLTAAGIESKSEARRLIAQNAVQLGNETLTNPNTTVRLKPGTILRIGKHRFWKLKIG